MAAIRPAFDGPLGPGRGSDGHPVSRLQSNRMCTNSDSQAAQTNHSRWTAQRANAWYEPRLWLVGCNFIPSTAINQLEMWQEDTFDPETIDRELGWAQGIGMNTARVYLHDLAWSQDPDGFKSRVSAFLDIASKRGIVPMLVLFDSCWNPEPKIGKQPETRLGVHNCGWVQSPGPKGELDASTWPDLERYVADVVGSFRDDPRILLWDVYNEPANQALPLLKETFRWVRNADPSQPISSGMFARDPDHAEVAAYQIAESDVITCHHYGPADDLRVFMGELRAHGRPIICTEWMARTHGSIVPTNLPVFKELGIGCINWGLVYGKTQTIYPWGSEAGTPEPALWFHDLFRHDGSPFDPTEIELFRVLTG